MDAQTLEPTVADAGSDRRFRELLERYRAPVARLSAGYERNRADRDDLTQDIWIAIWRALPLFRGDCSERTFIYRIAHNRAISHVSRRPTPTAPLDDAMDVPDPAGPTEQPAEAAAERAQLLAAVHGLSLAQREVVLLTLEGLPQREIAEILGITAVNVAVRLNRARAELARRMGGQR